MHCPVVIYALTSSLRSSKQFLVNSTRQGYFLTKMIYLPHSSARWVARLRERIVWWGPEFLTTSYLDVNQAFPTVGFTNGIWGGRWGGKYIIVNFLIWTWTHKFFKIVPWIISHQISHFRSNGGIFLIKSATNHKAPVTEYLSWLSFLDKPSVHMHIKRPSLHGTNPVSRLDFVSGLISTHIYRFSLRFNFI